MKPFFVRAADTRVEVWSGYRIQFGGMERHAWQTVLKAELKEALSRLAMPVGAPFASRTANSSSCGSVVPSGPLRTVRAPGRERRRR